MPEAPPERDRWTVGPAKTGAAAVLGGASLLGLTWVIVGRAPVPGPPPAQTPAPIPFAAAVAEPHATPPGVSSGAKPLDLEQANSGNPESPDREGSPAGPSFPAEREHASDPQHSTPSLALRIRVNAAPVAELELLPGIGPVLAQRIADDRARRGGFRSLDDLQRVPGIGEKKAEALTPYVRFD
ncbi:MAG: hypothetical protein DHS20C14_00760 [Phycisphaeraceae bacterium]|nr:MAG: hypothetical protein DHS20C14_00760 [Phycisphaeraceae bacterium]